MSGVAGARRFIVADTPPTLSQAAFQGLCPRCGQPHLFAGPVFSAQVVTFAMPHERLGEDVAAAIVLREGLAATESEIRDFAAARLAEFKVPRRVVILEEIPKGATGKLQRIGLAQKLGLS